MPDPHAVTFGVNLSCGTCGLTLAAVVAFGTYPEITNVAPDSPAAKAGLKAGDMLVAMDNLSLKSVEGTRAFRDVKPGQKVLLLVVREAEALKIWLIAGPPSK
jgi:C-terminal processing protease CtpA/Prc